MKMRSSFPLSGIFISVIDQLADEIAEPDGDQTERDRQRYIGSGVKPLSFLHEIQGLQAKRGKRGITAADAHHQKLDHEWTQVRMNPSLGSGDGRNRANEKGPGDIHGERVPRKNCAQAIGDDARQPVAGDPTDGAAQSDPKIFHLQTVSAVTNPALPPKKKRMRYASPLRAFR